MDNKPIEISKSFDVAVDKLYNAWVDKTALAEWWKPAGRQLKSLEATVEAGGNLKYTFGADDANENMLVIEGRYKEVQPNQKLVYSWNWRLDNDSVKDSDYELTVEFADSGSGSTIKVKQENSSAEEGLYPTEKGWEDALNALATFLQK